MSRKELTMISPRISGGKPNSLTVPSRTPKEPYPNGESPSPFLPGLYGREPFGQVDKTLRTRSPIRAYSKTTSVGRRRLQRCGLGPGLLYPARKYEPHQAHTARRPLRSGSGKPLGVESRIMESIVRCREVKTERRFAFPGVIQRLVQQIQVITLLIWKIPSNSRNPHRRPKYTM